MNMAKGELRSPLGHPPASGVSSGEVNSPALTEASNSALSMPALSNAEAASTIDQPSTDFASLSMSVSGKPIAAPTWRIAIRGR